MKTNFFKFYKYPAWILIASLALIISSCSKDDEPSNQAPSQSSLVTPSNQEKDVDISEVELSWKASTDPDGDTVSYDVYLDTLLPPEEKIMGDVSEVNLKLQNDLKYSTTYYWNVVAKDQSGAESNSEIATFTTRDAMVEDLIVGKWFMKSAVVNGNQVIVSECLSQTYFEFTADQTLRFVLYQGSPCGIAEDELYNYQITNAGNLVLTLSTNSTVESNVEVISITETHLELVINEGTQYNLERDQ
ncbi:lipocalin family protein [Galbibacter sp.]|uniref:lipocalin family protein n=1 Tax=Galbibacter sp. TaxID=2918471 RepID=UPI003A952898